LFWFTRCTTTITGGRAPFTYVQKEDTSAVHAGTTFTTVSNANADTYTFVITNGCTTTIATTVSPITDPTVTAAL
jgi:hypothetical protein